MNNRFFVLLFLCCSVAALRAEPIVPIVARTQSGRTIELAKADEKVASFMLGPAPEELRIDDPVIAIEGLDRLTGLTELTIVLFPQLSGFGFLASIPRLEHLILSHCRIDDLSSIVRLPALRRLRIEMCRGPNRGPVLPSGMLDFADESRLESLVLLDCGLLSPPALLRVPSGLDYLDLSWNGMRIETADAPTLAGYSTIEVVMIEGAVVAEGVFDSFPNLRATIGR